MKRHINLLLQRKRSEFEGAIDTRHSARLNPSTGSMNTHMKDGYDWLQQISRAQLNRVVAS